LLIVSDALKYVTQKTETIQKLDERIEETEEETFQMETAQIQKKRLLVDANHPRHSNFMSFWTINETISAIDQKAVIFYCKLDEDILHKVFASPHPLNH
jgi:hypothetical protein